MPTFGSLFAGIGGIDAGLEWAGWECRWHVEWNGFCTNALDKHWPDVPHFGDIAAVDRTDVERVDLLAGGFPCQPISSAGRQKAQSDERWLWPEFLRAIRALRPRLVLVENVTNLLAINDGSAFGEVVGDLAASGYDAEWDCIPAAAVGAPHERDRVWVVAYPNRDGRDPASGRQGGAEGPALSPALASGEHGGAGVGRPLRGAGPTLADATIDGRGAGRARRPVGDSARQAELTHRQMADPERLRLPRPRELVEPLHSKALADWKANQPVDGGWWATEPPVGRLVDGVPDGLARWREAALQGLGNAVVPQIPELLGRRLMELVA